MKLKEIYTGNIAVTVVLLLAYYWFTIPLLFWFALLLLILTLISEKTARFIGLILKTVFKFIGSVNSKIILSLFYFVVLTPIAIVVKIFTKKRDVKSNWIEVHKEYNFKDMW